MMFFGIFCSLHVGVNGLMHNFVDLGLKVTQSVVIGLVRLLGLMNGDVFATGVRVANFYILSLEIMPLDVFLLEAVGNVRVLAKAPLVAKLAGLDSLLNQNVVFVNRTII